MDEDRGGANSGDAYDMPPLGPGNVQRQFRHHIDLLSFTLTYFYLSTFFCQNILNVSDVAAFR